MTLRRFTSRNAFRKGQAAAARGEFLEGLARFEASVPLARSHPVNRILGLLCGGLAGSGSQPSGARARPR